MTLSEIATIAAICAFAFSTGAAAQSLPKSGHKPARKAVVAATQLQGSAKENVVDNATTAKAQATVLASPSYRATPTKIEADKGKGIRAAKGKAAASASAGADEKVALERRPEPNR